MNVSNPFQSPPPIDAPPAAAATATTTTFSVRRLFADLVAGMLVGTTYGSAGGACVSGLRAALFGNTTTVYVRVEQTVMAAVFGAFVGAIIGLTIGAVLALLLGVVFRLLRMENSVTFYWGGVTISAVAGSLAGFGGGFMMAQRAFSDPLAMVWYPIGAVIGGMIGAMAGRQWIRIVAGQHVSPFV
jgi:hypothetical protein